MNEPTLTLTTDAPGFAPGTPVTGTVRWSGLPPRAHFEVRLGWWADGVGNDRPAGDLGSVAFTAGLGEESGERAFSLPIPESAPPTLDGTLISLRHALEVRTGETIRMIPVIVSPTLAPLQTSPGKTRDNPVVRIGEWLARLSGDRRSAPH